MWIFALSVASESGGERGRKGIIPMFAKNTFLAIKIEIKYLSLGIETKTV